MFWPRFLRLLASVAFEVLCNAFYLIAFLFRRRHVRARIRALMLTQADFTAADADERGSPTGLKAIACLAFASLCLVSSGCQSFPGASFGRQVDELTWSAKTMVEMPNWKESLLLDLKTLSDPEWDQMGDSLSQLGW